MEKYRVQAVRNDKVLHTTYVQSRPENVEKAAKAALQIFVSGSFSVHISPMFEE